MSCAAAIISGAVQGGTPPVAPIASFTYTPLHPTIGGSIQLTDTSLNNPTSWSWFVNGPGGLTQFSTAQNPTYYFATGGTYTFSMSATNDYGTGNSGGTPITPTAP